jgi:hypothetical protein
VGALTAGESNGNAQVKVTAERSDVLRMGQEPRPEVGRMLRKAQSEYITAHSGQAVREAMALN